MRLASLRVANQAQLFQTLGAWRYRSTRHFRMKFEGKGFDVDETALSTALSFRRWVLSTNLIEIDRNQSWTLLLSTTTLTSGVSQSKSWACRQQMTDLQLQIQPFPFELSSTSISEMGGVKLQLLRATRRKEDFRKVKLIIDIKKFHFLVFSEQLS